MQARARFAYVADAAASPASLLPRLPLMLHYGNQAAEVVGLLDTGATVNVLPYHIGLALGARWDEQTVSVQLSGSLGRFEAKALVVFASHTEITAVPVRMVFAWTLAEEIPVIFGQVNFFLVFDVCFFRADEAFEVTLRTT